MGRIGKEIIQSRIWVDPNAQDPPNMNYKDTYPITVYEAVKENMEDDAPNLKDNLDSLQQQINNKQPIFPAKPANYLMTFAGIAGAVGGIQITRDIPWDPESQTNDKIPTEKAVGDLLMKLGLVDADGNIDPDGGRKVRWGDIIGRPNFYYGLGMSTDGFVVQKAVTEAINNVDYKLTTLSDDTAGKFTALDAKVDNHIVDKNNPHNVTLEQLGAVNKEAFDFHIQNFDNPHNVTKEQVGLGNVDNTSDLDKPISNSTQIALDAINGIIEELDKGISNCVVNGKYDQESGKFTLTLRDGSTIIMDIPINGLVDGISYDKENKELVVTELGGHISRIDVSDLFIRYLGDDSANITVEINDTENSMIKKISATINPESITDAEMANDSVITRILKDQSVSTEKIKDLSVTTIKLEDESITTDKLGKLAVTTSRVADKAINGKKIFSSIVDNRVLAVLTNGDDPEWMQINSRMIADKAVETINIANDAIIAEKIADKAVTTNKLDDLAVTAEKISDLTIINEKIANSTISGTKIVTDPLFMGTPSISKRPDSTSNNNQIPDTYWVNDALYNIRIRNENILDRVVDGRTLFSSPTSNRALVVLDANSNPVWDLINNSMMGIDSVNTNNIIDSAVTDPKIANDTVKSRHVSKDAILSEHIKESEIKSINIWPSDIANRVIASLDDNAHPVYSKINRKMLEDAVIGTEQIENSSVTLSKIASSELSNRLLAVVKGRTDPTWVQANNEMLGDNSVDGRVLFKSPVTNRVIAVNDRSTDPAWQEVTGGMIATDTIVSRNIGPGAVIGNKHIADKSIESGQIADRAINGISIAEHTITGKEIFTSGEPNRVLAVTTTPYADPQWLQVTTDMIKDYAVTREKIFKSSHPYRVLGTTQGDVPPEYIKITADFIVDDSITPQKLVHDFVLFGVPETTKRPEYDADNRQIPDTHWVRETVANMINDFNPEILFDTVFTEMISDRAITGRKLFTHPEAPRVLGITHPNEDPEYLLIEEDLIVDGSITKYKIQKDITLLGSPTVEIRPFAEASDAMGGGQLIPDCQWVLDRIGSVGGAGGSTGIFTKFDPEYFIQTADGLLSLNIVNMFATRAQIDELFNGSGSGDGTGGSGGGSGGGGGSVGFESILTDNIANRAVTGDKLFSSTIPNRLLGVFAANTSPQYLQAINDMIGDRSIDGRTLFTSSSANKILGVTIPGSNPDWMLINNAMMDKNSVSTLNIKDKNITNVKVADRVINGRTLFTSIVPNRVLTITEELTDPQWGQINYDMMGDKSVGTNNLQEKCVITKNIADYSVTQIKLENAPIIDTYRIIDKAVTTNKIEDLNITNQKIAMKCIDESKLVDDIILPGHPTVHAHTSYSTRSLRNTIISPDAPSGGENGDIWLRYI